MSNTTYVQNNPDLLAHYNANVKGSGKSMAEWGAEHWNAFGKNENRENTPTHVETAKPMSPASYRPNVAIASAGASVFTGTNVPTAGYSQEQIDHYNARLNEAIREGDTRNANDVLFDIAYAKKGVGVSQGRSEGQGQGNERVGAVQSGMYKLDSGPLWAEQRINSTNDRYVLRDEQGAPTGERIRYDDAAGVVRGTPGNWTSVGSWGGNEKAGIIEGQPTTTPPPSGILSSGIRDLDEGGFFATGGQPGVNTTISTTGPPNPTVPSFGYPQYRDWTRFMPTNFQLAEGGGMHYQPGAWGNLPVTGGTPIGAGNNIWNTGTTTSGTTETGGPGPINPNIWGNTNTTGGGNTVTDAQGKTWIMSNGQWIPADSELGSILASGDTPRHPLGHYDSSGAWIGAEGLTGAGNVNWGGGAFSPMEIASGIAGPNVIRDGISMGNRQAGLNLLGRLGMFGDAFGATRPETGFGGESMSEAEVEASINGSGYGGGQWT